MSARRASLVLPFAGLLLLAAPARAQEEPPPPPAPAPAPAAPGGCTVVVVLPGTQCGTPVVIQTPPAAPAPAPAAMPPGAYYPPPYGYYPPPYGYYPAPQAPPRPRSAFSAKLWAGPSYQRLYDVNMYGADFGLSLGAQRGISGWYAEMEGIVGRTQHGLPTYQYWIGPTWEGKIDRLHIGLGVHFGWVGIGRVTAGDAMSGMGFGFFGFASYDLYQSDEGHALYVGARMTGNWLDGGPSTVPQYGPNATLGWRY